MWWRLKQVLFQRSESWRPKMTLTNNQLKLHRRLAGRQRGAGGGRGGEGGWVDWG